MQAFLVHLHWKYIAFLQFPFLGSQYESAILLNSRRLFINDQKYGDPIIENQFLNTASPSL